jgi:hypothetical protein
MRPEEREELLAAYALDALSGPEAIAVEALVRDDPSAAEQLAGYHEIVDLIALDVPLRHADPALRTRVLRAAKRTGRPRRRLPLQKIMVTAALIAALAVTVGWGATLQHKLDYLDSETGTLRAIVAADARRLDALDRENIGGGEQALRVELRNAVDTQQRIVAILTDPEVQEAVLDGTTAGHGARGLYLWSRELGAGVMIAQQLPPLPLGIIYEIWLINRFGEVSGGTFLPSPSGDAQVLIELDSAFDPLSVAVAPAPPGGTDGLQQPIVLAGFVP